MTTPDAAALQTFHMLSRELTGVGELDEAMGAELFSRLASAPVGAALPSLLDEFRAILAGGGDVQTEIGRRIIANETLAPVAQQIILLWYTSAFLIENKWQFGTPRQYFSSLMWPIIGAHPPALSGGYFGYWKYPPEL